MLIIQTKTMAVKRSSVSRGFYQMGALEKCSQPTILHPHSKAVVSTAAILTLWERNNPMNSFKSFPGCIVAVKAAEL